MDFTDPTTKIAVIAFTQGLIGVAIAYFKERRLKQEGELLPPESHAGSRAKRTKNARRIS